jgi:phage I-like protein
MAMIMALAVDVRRDKFLERLPHLLKSVGKPTRLGPAEADALRKNHADLKLDYKELDKELETARRQIAALEKVQAANRELKRLTSIVREAVTEELATTRQLFFVTDQAPTLVT